MNINLFINKMPVITRSQQKKYDNITQKYDNITQSNKCKIRSNEEMQNVRQSEIQDETQNNKEMQTNTKNQITFSKPANTFDEFVSVTNCLLFKCLLFKINKKHQFKSCFEVFQYINVSFNIIMKYADKHKLTNLLTVIYNKIIEFENNYWNNKWKKFDKSLCNSFIYELKIAKKNVIGLITELGIVIEQI